MVRSTSEDRVAKAELAVADSAEKETSARKWRCEWGSRGWHTENTTARSGAGQAPSRERRDGGRDRMGGRGGRGDSGGVNGWRRWQR